MSKGTKADEDEGSGHFDVTCELKLIAYLEDLIKMQGFGTGKSGIARNFIWKEVNRLIEVGRLPPR